MPEGDDNRRIFLVELVGDSESFVDAVLEASLELLNFDKVLDEVGDHIKDVFGGTLGDVTQNMSKATESVTANTAAVEESTKVTETASMENQRLSHSFESVVVSAAAITSAYLYLRSVMDSMIATAEELNKLIARSTFIFDRHNVAAKDLSMTFLGLGRDASDFMRASMEFEKAGAQTEEQLVQLSEAAFKAGMMMGMTAEEVASGMRQLAVSLNAPIGEMGRLMQVATQLNMRLGATMEGLIRVAQAAPLAQEYFGITAEGMMHMGAMFERAAGNAEDGAATIEQIMNEMINNMGNNLMAAGLDVARFAELLRTDAAGATQYLAKQVGDMTAMQKRDLVVLGGLSQQQVRILERLGMQAEASSAAIKTIGAALYDTESFTEMYEYATNNLSDQLHLMWMELGAIWERISIMVLPVINLLVKVVRGFIYVLSLIPNVLLAAVGGFALLATGLVAVITAIATAVQLFSTYVLVSKAAQVATSVFTTVTSILTAVLTGNTAALNANVISRGLESIGTAQNTVATLMNTAAQSQNTVALWVLSAASGALAFATRVLTIAKTEGIVAAISYAVTSGATSIALMVEKAAAFGLALAQGALTIATTIVTAAQWAWNAAMYANPIGLVVVGVLALIAAIVLLATKFRPLKDLLFFFALGWASIYDAIVETIQEAFYPLGDVIDNLVIAWDNLMHILGLADEQARTSRDTWKTLAEWLVFAYKIFFLPLRASLVIVATVIEGLVKIVTLFIMAIQKVVLWVKNWRQTLQDIYSFIVDVFATAFYPVILAINLLKAAVGLVMPYITSALQPVIDGLGLVADAFNWIAGEAEDSKKSMQGSSFLHIKEGVSEVLPSLKTLGSAMGDIEKQAKKLNKTSAKASVSSVTDAVVNTTMNTTSGAAARAMRQVVTATAAQQAAAPARAARDVAAAGAAATERKAGERAPGPVEIPITISLDNRVLGQAMVKITQDMLVGRHNAPLSAQRGIPGGI